jgi:hypothetical protein
LSVQLSVAHVLPVQTLEAQSFASVQALPEGQGTQVPPQSTSVSAAFFVLSVQVACGGDTVPGHPASAKNDKRKMRFMKPPTAPF